MLDIELAIEQSKNKENISDGGSSCFDFGDVVLVKYECLLKYIKNNNRIREKSEEIMETINKKNELGVNTPKHLAVKRVIEDDKDVCYVLQEKCRGINCSKISNYGVSFEKMCSSLEFILNIPFEHYKKLIHDGSMLFEMGYEAKNKNLFYDRESGFWYIDFLDNEEDYVFDQNNPTKLFEALNYRIPRPLQIKSIMEYDEKLTDAQTKKKNILEHSIKAKTLLAIKTVFPNFEKYEKFYLFLESDDYKDYLMKEKIVDKDLMNIELVDYDIFEELYELVIDRLMDKIINKSQKFWSIETNDIGNDSDLFNLREFYEKSSLNTVNRDDFSDKYDYQYEVNQQYNKKVLLDLVDKLHKVDKNENVVEFLENASKSLNITKNKLK